MLVFFLNFAWILLVTLTLWESVSILFSRSHLCVNNLFRPKFELFLVRCFFSVDQVIALYSYRKRDSDELNFDEGIIINVIDKTVYVDWWLGELNGVTGWFPSIHVTSLTAASLSKCYSHLDCSTWNLRRRYTFKNRNGMRWIGN